MIKISSVKVLGHYKIELVFSDGTEGAVDLSPLKGKGVFADWNDYERFKRVAISAAGDLEWDDGVDLCADSLYLKITNKTPEQLFPALKKEFTHA